MPEQPHSASSLLQRRQNDSSEATPDNILRILLEIRSEIHAIKSAQTVQSEAFVMDDLGKPDYHGHRKDHFQRMRESEVVASYKQDVTKKLLTTVAIFLIGLAAAGFMESLKR